MYCRARKEVGLWKAFEQRSVVCLKAITSVLLLCLPSAYSDIPITKYIPFDQQVACQSVLVAKLRQPVRAASEGEEVFGDQRGMDELFVLLGSRFQESFLSLTSRDHVIFPGGGKGMMIKDLFEYRCVESGLVWKHIFHRGLNHKFQGAKHKKLYTALHDLSSWSVRPASEKPRVSMVGYDKGIGSPVRKHRHEGRFRHIKGKYFENQSNKKIRGRFGLAKMIVDVNDVFRYTPFPSQVLRKYLTNLDPNGEIYLFAGYKERQNGLLGERVIVDGKEVGLLDWLKTIEGISIQVLENRYFNGGTAVTFLIKKNGTRIRIPQVDLVGILPSMRSRAAMSERRVLGVSIREDAVVERVDPTRIFYQFNARRPAKDLLNNRVWVGPSLEVRLEGLVRKYPNRLAIVDKVAIIRDSEDNNTPSRKKVLAISSSRENAALLRDLADALGRDTISFPSKELSGHLFTRVGQTVVDYQRRRVSLNGFKTSIRVEDIRWPSGRRIEPIISLSDSELARLYRYIHTARSNPHKLLGRFNERGIISGLTEGTLSENQPTLECERHNCVTWMSLAPIGENGETLAELLRVPKVGDGVRVPGLWIKAIASSSNQRVPLVLYWDSKPVSEIEWELKNTKEIRWKFETQLHGTAQWYFEDPRIQNKFPQLLK